jgi:hypothetical protein
MRQTNRRPLRRYGVYGVSLSSEIPLALPAAGRVALAGVELRTAPAAFFSRAARAAAIEPADAGWYRYGRLADRSTYLRWKGLGEFVVSADGRTVRCRRAQRASSEAFQVYLVQRALSFALVKQGFEPLHATAVVVGDRAVALLGDSGFGKSSLAASFLEAGHRLLTDDLLLVTPHRSGLYGHPGPPRIKLFPATARRLLDRRARGAAMHAATKKLVLPLAAAQMARHPVPLAGFYILQRPRRQTRGLVFEPLDPRAACIEMVRHTFNRLHRDRDRLERQFLQASRMALELPVKRLFHPRVWHRLPDVRDALIADLEEGEGACTSHSAIA